MFATERTIVSGERLIVNVECTLRAEDWKLGKELSELFIPDATTGKRVIDIYMTEKNDPLTKTYDLSNEIIGITKNGVKMSQAEILSITSETKFEPGKYQFKVVIGGKINGIPVFKNRSTYNISFGGFNFKKSNGAALNVTGVELNVVKLNVL